MRNIDASESLTAPELKVIQTGGSGPGAQFTLFAAQRAAPDEAADLAGKRGTRVSEARK